MFLFLYHGGNFYTEYLILRPWPNGLRSESTQVKACLKTMNRESILTYIIQHHDLYISINTQRHERMLSVMHVQSLTSAVTRHSTHIYIRHSTARHRFADGGWTDSAQTIWWRHSVELRYRTIRHSEATFLTSHRKTEEISTRTVFVACILNATFDCQAKGVGLHYCWVGREGKLF